MMAAMACLVVSDTGKGTTLVVPLVSPMDPASAAEGQLARSEPIAGFIG
jgi:hypothetical protein